MQNARGNNRPADAAPNAVAQMRVMLVEDHVILRQGLKALLETDPRVQVVGETGTAREALAAIELIAPSIVIVDIALPGQSGIALITALRKRRCDLPILVLTALENEACLREAMHAGASGLVLKDSSHAELIEALNLLSIGKRYFCESLPEELVRSLADPASRDGARATVRVITPREREVLTRIALGQSNKRAASELGLSVKTVEKHRSNLMRKLDLHNSAALTMFALRYGLVRSEQAQAD